jgi:hypothetical protein
MVFDDAKKKMIDHNQKREKEKIKGRGIKFQRALLHFR